MILFSIIVPTFNVRDTLAQCLESAIGQSLAGKEIIVVDGGSTDGTIDVIRSYGAHIAKWVSEPDQGVYDAFNKGVKQARGQWLYFLGADDYFFNSEVLKSVSTHLAGSQSGARVAYGQVALIGPGDQTLAIVGEPWEIAKKRLPAYMPISHQGVFHSRELFTTHGEFDPTFRMAGDYEFLLRELFFHDALYIPGLVVAGHRIGGISSTAGNHTRTLWELRRAQKRHGILAPRLGWIIRLLAAWTRSFLVLLLGDRRGHVAMDALRGAFGKKRHWSKI
ncbi:MAG: glycosyltransferase family 2 protein [Burkholderiales bacterium]